MKISIEQFNQFHTDFYTKGKITLVGGFKRNNDLRYGQAFMNQFPQFSESNIMAPGFGNIDLFNEENPLKARELIMNSYVDWRE